MRCTSFGKLGDKGYSSFVIGVTGIVRFFMDNIYYVNYIKILLI